MNEMRDDLDMVVQNIYKFKRVFHVSSGAYHCWENH